MTKFLMPFSINIIAVITLMISVSSLAWNVESPYIEVKGQASVLAEPDRFSLNIAIVERGRHSDKIRAVVDHKSNQVVQVAKNLGVKSHDINSARVTLTVIKDKPSITIEGLAVSQRVGNDGYPNNRHNKVFVGVGDVNGQNDVSVKNNIKPQYFELRRSISVNFSSIEVYDKFLNKVIKLGVNHISPLAMSIENTEKYYQQALVQAFTNAKNKASKIAIHSNVILGKLLHIQELSSNYYSARPRFSSILKSAEITPKHNSQVGNQVIKASVLVKFSIQD